MRYRTFRHVHIINQRNRDLLELLKATAEHTEYQ